MIDTPATDLLTRALAVLETAAAVHWPAFAGTADALSLDATAARLAHARSALVAVLERGGPDELREISIALHDLLDDTDTPDDRHDTGRVAVAGSEADRVRIEEWSRIPATAAARRGSSAGEMAMRSRNGRGGEVLALICTAAGPYRRSALVGTLASTGDSSWISHVLRDLEAASLINRWRDGRDTLVEATTAGRELARLHRPRAAAPETVSWDADEAWKEAYARTRSEELSHASSVNERRPLDHPSSLEDLSILAAAV